MANDENLIPINSRTTNEAREISSKGGKKSGESRRRKRDMRKKMQMILSLVPQNCDDYNLVSEMGVDISEIDNEMVMLAGLFNQAKSGNIQAVKEIRNIIGDDIPSAELELKEQALKKADNSNGQLDKLIEGLKNG